MIWRERCINCFVSSGGGCESFIARSRDSIVFAFEVMRSMSFGEVRIAVTRLLIESSNSSDSGATISRK